MNVEDLIMVSNDDHVIEPENMFENHVPARWKDQAPKIVRDGGGVEDRQILAREGEGARGVGLRLFGCAARFFRCFFDGLFWGLVGLFRRLFLRRPLGFGLVRFFPGTGAPCRLFELQRPALELLDRAVRPTQHGSRLGDAHALQKTHDEAVALLVGEHFFQIPGALFAVDRTGESS